jgi:hypothetical protein
MQAVYCDMPFNHVLLLLLLLLQMSPPPSRASSRPSGSWRPRSRPPTCACLCGVAGPTTSRAWLR